jgi:hypothetical protein
VSSNRSLLERQRAELDAPTESNRQLQDGIPAMKKKLAETRKHTESIKAQKRAEKERQREIMEKQLADAKKAEMLMKKTYALRKSVKLLKQKEVKQLLSELILHSSCPAEPQGAGIPSPKLPWRDACGI